METPIGTIDLTVIVVYLVGIVGLGCWVGLRHRKTGGQSKDFFLAGGRLTWPVIGLALFSTNISTIHLVSFAQEGYVNGLAYGNFEWMAPFTLIITALFFAPFYLRSRVATLPDFLEKRYNRACRDWLAILSIIAAIFIHIGFSLYTGALVLYGMFGVNLYVSIIVIAALTGLYTIIGGLTSVVVTESIQTIVLLIGSIIITMIALVKVGGMAGITDTLQAHGEMVKLTVLRSSAESPKLPWYAVLLGYPVIGIWYWCTDQTIVQRVLGAKDENHARVGPLFCGFVKILPVFLFVLPGLICYVMVQKGQLNEDKLGSLPLGHHVMVDQQSVPVTDGHIALAGRTLTVGEKIFSIQGKSAAIDQHILYIDGKAQKVDQPTKDTYAFMIRELLPVGLKGVVAAALLAALMGTVAGALNSIATLFSYDIVKRWRPRTTDRQLVLIGRITTFVAMLVAIAWSPLIARFESIYQGIIALICYIAPPITAVFLVGILWRRASSLAAQVTLYAGSTLGLIVFLIDWFHVQFPPGVTRWLDAINVIYYDAPHQRWGVVDMVTSFYMCLFCVLLAVVLSKRWPHQHTAESEKLVWNNPLEAIRSPGWRGIGNYKFLAALLFVTMVVLYTIFA